ncbi:MAG: hypothetical protein JNM89_03545 [Hyphomicrobiaceae bacterium]|nr:hypothetical protein [Hyphomicrobiaceae bacterium]
MSSVRDTIEVRVGAILRPLAPKDDAVRRITAEIEQFERNNRHRTLVGTVVFMLVMLAVASFAPAEARNDVIAVIVTFALALYTFVKPSIPHIERTVLQAAWGGPPLPDVYIKELQAVADGERSLQERWVAFLGAAVVFFAAILKWMS